MIDSDCYLIKCCIQFQCHYSNRSPVPRNSVKLGTGNGVQSGTVSGSKPGKKKNSVKNHSAIEGSGEGPIKPSVGDVESSVYDDDDVDVATSFSVPISLRSWRRRVPPGIGRRDAGRIFRLRLVLFLKLQKEGTTTTAPTIAKKTNKQTVKPNGFRRISLKRSIWLGWRQRIRSDRRHNNKNRKVIENGTFLFWNAFQIMAAHLAILDQLVFTTSMTWNDESMKNARTRWKRTKRTKQQQQRPKEKKRNLPLMGGG